MPILEKSELQRYARHLNIPNFGIKAQQKLKNARVLVVGAGGLGSPVLLYLAAAGIGHIGLVEFDTVDNSNLQRQVLYNTNDVGTSKAQLAKKRLNALNPFVKVTLFEEKINRKNALEIISQYDVVADGTDNFPTRYLVNDACVLAGKINVYASIYRFEGQVAVFNFLKKDGTHSPNYRDLFPAPPPPGMIPSCAEGGVLGVLPGIVGSLQANEVIKLITGFGEPLIGKILLIDVATMLFRKLAIQKNSASHITELIDYEGFCGLKNSDLKEITVKELKGMIQDDEEFQLIDVREVHEFEVQNLGGELIPLAQITAAIDRIDRNRKVVIYCQSGQRSAAAIRALQKQVEFSNLYNLQGGVKAWNLLD